MIYCLVSYEMAKMMVDTPNLEAVILGNEVSNAQLFMPFLIYCGRKHYIAKGYSRAPLLQISPPIHKTFTIPN
jgi:hypothetical protein